MRHLISGIKLFRLFVPKILQLGDMIVEGHIGNAGGVSIGGRIIIVDVVNLDN